MVRVENRVMPEMFAVAQHRALKAAWERLSSHDQLLAFLRDIHVVGRLRRVVDIHNILRAQLWHHARIQIHQGEPQAWDRGGVERTRIDVLGFAAKGPRRSGVERGRERPNQGVVILDTPLGHVDVAKDHLHSKIASHMNLLERMPAVGDLQAAWLLLLFGASARANFLFLAPGPRRTT